MKKVLILLILLCVGCSYKDKINTIIEEDNNILIGINYPNTDYKSLNNIIKIDIKNIYNNFKTNFNFSSTISEKSELNIDYKITEFKDYISIILEIHISSNILDKPINYVKTYFFDKNEETLLNIKEIIDKNNIANIKNDLSKNNINIHYLENYLNQINFFIDKDHTYIYFNINNEKIELIYKNKEIKFLKQLILNENIKKVDNFYISNQVLDINKKYVALTFDDGPSIYTKDILEILKKHNVSATFFILGNKVPIYSDLLNEMLENGNIIGNHSYNHKWLVKLNENELKEQINKTNEEIYKYTGYIPTILRPTYGSVNKKIKNITNMNIILWTVDTMDWKYKSVNKIIYKATNNLKDGDIILMHDIYKRTALSLDKIITEIKKQGFEIVTILELKEIQKMRKNE